MNAIVGERTGNSFATQPRMRTALLAALVAGVTTFSLFGCGDASVSSGIPRRGVPTVGDPSSDGPADTTSDPDDPTATSAPPPPSTAGTTSGAFDVAVDNNTLQADLDTNDSTLNVTITPKDGFQGQVALAVTGLPAGVTAAVSPASVTLNTTPATAKVTFTVEAGAAPTPDGVAAAIEATSGATKATANLTFKVNNRITATIVTNADAMRQANQKFALFGPTFDGSTTFTKGIQVVVKNGDSVKHVIHGSNGFVHGQSAIDPGDTDVVDGKEYRTLGSGNPNGYIHGEQNGTDGSFKFPLK